MASLHRPWQGYPKQRIQGGKPICEHQLVQRHSLKFSEFPYLLPRDAPYLGEHNQDVLGRYLGYSVEQVRGLEADGLLKREQPPWTQ